MKNIIYLLFATLILVSCGTSKNTEPKANNAMYRYDIEYVKNAGDGLSNVKVWSYAKNAKQAMAKCKADAVRGVLFKGYSGQGAVQPPLVRNANAYSQHKDFFDNFFNNNEYQQFVSNVVDGSYETRKVGKEYKVACIMTINVKALRKYLEQSGIIRGLSSGF